VLGPGGGKRLEDEKFQRGLRILSIVHDSHSVLG
jgi:hypothetical protein